MNEESVRAAAPAGTIWWLIKNDRGDVCRPQRGGCGKVHEYWTHRCRPVAFDKPWEWEIFQKKVTRDVGVTVQAIESVTFTCSLGTPIPITEREASELNVIRNPEEGFKRVGVSLPGAPVRVNVEQQVQALKQQQAMRRRQRDLIIG